MDIGRIAIVFLNLAAAAFGAGEPATKPAPVRPVATQPAANNISKDTQIDRVRLLDVQGLWGGRNIFMNADGSAVIQIVGKGMMEKRYEVKLAPEKIREFEKLLAKHDFFNIKIDVRPAIPDEGCPAITVRLSSGRKGCIAKLSGIKNPDFDAILQWLLDLAQTTKDAKAVYEGKYEGKWRPQVEARSPSPEQTKEIAELIRQLGDNDSKVREAATKRLMETGDIAKKQLEEKLKEENLDPEVKARAKAILADINDF
ncbi:MAG: hypothetical protein HZA50_09705 [Planctomycetes bacterium]|nr:hypothetical protein [Planctomycetota bacterium]